MRPYLLRKWTVHKNNRQPKAIPPSMANDFYDSVGVGAHDDPQNNRPPNPIRPRSFATSPHAVILEQSEESRGATPLEDDTGGGKEVKSEKRVRRGGYHPPAKNTRSPNPIGLSELLQRMVRTVEDACPYKC